MHIATQIDLHGALFRMVRNMVGCMVPWMQPKECGLCGISVSSCNRPTLLHQVAFWICFCMYFFSSLKVHHITGLVLEVYISIRSQRRCCFFKDKSNLTKPGTNEAHHAAQMGENHSPGCAFLSLASTLSCCFGCLALLQ